MKTPLASNNRLSKIDGPEVVNPNVHRQYCSIVGCLSYLVNMTRPELDFRYSQLSKFMQYSGLVHLEDTERVLQFVRATYDQDISCYDWVPDKRNKLVGWVDSDFTSDIDSRKSMMGYFMSLNGCPISWKPTRGSNLDGHLSTCAAEFVVGSQVGQEVFYLRALLKGFGYSQTGPAETWEDNMSCIMLSENTTIRNSSRHVDGNYNIASFISSRSIRCSGIPPLMGFFIISQRVCVLQTVNLVESKLVFFVLVLELMEV